MSTEMVLLPEMPGRRAFIRRVSDPEKVPDVLDPEGRDESVLLVEQALGSRVTVRLEDVRRQVFDAVGDEYPHKPVSFCWELAEVHLRSALDHFQSPVGLDFKTRGIPGSVLLYRGSWWIRRKGGRLAWLQGDDFTPDFSRWCANVRFAEAVVKGGLLRGRS